MTHTSIPPTEVDAIRDLAVEAAHADELESGSLYAYRFRDEVKLVDTVEYGANPRRKAGNVIVHDAASFIAYHLRHATDGSETFADNHKNTIQTVLNSHEEGHEGSAGWSDHRVTLRLQVTEAWTAWREIDGKMLGQVEFAEFVEQRLPDFVEPAGATMLELAQSFQANRSVSFESGHRLQSSETQLVYREETEAKAGRRGDLTIPNVVTLALSPYEGQSPYKVTGRLRYRISDGGLRLGVVLERPTEIERAAFTDVFTQVEGSIEGIVFFGVAQQ